MKKPSYAHEEELQLHNTELLKIINNEVKGIVSRENEIINEVETEKLNLEFFEKIRIKPFFRIYSIIKISTYILTPLLLIFIILYFLFRFFRNKAKQTRIQNLFREQNE